jgi:hypothetical protein
MTTRQTFSEVSVLPPVLLRSGALLRMYLDNAAQGGEHGNTAVLELGLAQPVSLSKQPTARHTPPPLILGQQERRRPAPPSSATTPGGSLLPRPSLFLAPFRGPRAHAQSRMAWGTILALHALVLQLGTVIDCGECPMRAGGRIRAGSRRWSGDRSPCRQPRCLLIYQSEWRSRMRTRGALGAT